MILYAVHYKGPITNDTWSIVTIHKDKTEALYWRNKCHNQSPECEYEVIEINIDDDVIYDCDSYDD